MKTENLKISHDEFFAATNGRARTRLFDVGDYGDYANAFAEATTAARKHEAFYSTHDSGGVANSYGYSATSATWGVYVSPTSFAVISVAARQSCSGRSVKCIYCGGERTYLKNFREANQLGLAH